MLSLSRINSLQEISDVDCFFVDVYGVLYDGQTYYPSALDICKQMIRCGKQVYILSNLTSISSYFIKKHSSFGFIKGVHYTDITTSGDILKNKLDNGFLTQITGAQGKWSLIGCPNELLMGGVMERFTPDFQEASVIYLGSLQENEKKFATIDPFLPNLSKALKRHIPLICANPDYYALDGSFKHVTQGALAKWYEDHGGYVYWIGKPYPEIYQYALKKAATTPQRSVAVGDTLRTDILGGFQSGMRTVLITETGVFADEHKETSLNQLVRKYGVTPDFLMTKMQ